METPLQGNTDSVAWFWRLFAIYSLGKLVINICSEFVVPQENFLLTTQPYFKN